MSTKLSEEDIRTRVVYEWLKGHGFSPHDISLEYAFDIKLGRNIYTVDGATRKNPSYHPRSDILVRTNDGRNLLIIEVKAPNEHLDEAAREQAISYARLLREGGIAPFVILTNGQSSKIYDSFSGELLVGKEIPTDHRHVKSGYKVTTDDLAFRAKALENFISLSQENFLAFCQNQVDYRMHPLRSNDPLTGKKYIPSLYIDRPEPQHKLNKLLFEAKKHLVVVTGPPQVGKTSFICHAVETYLAKGLPCLFFPAIGLEKGLLWELSEDFEWQLGNGNLSHQALYQQLCQVSFRVNQRLFIFIDGWNETSRQFAALLDQDCKRIGIENITIIITFTNTAAPRLLKDDAGNPAHVAEAASLTVGDIELLAISPEDLLKQKPDSIVFLNHYTQDELTAAYGKYAQLFDVLVPLNHQKSPDPFLIRIGMQHFRGRTLPEFLDEPTLMVSFLKGKAIRAVGLEYPTITSMLSILGRELFEQDQAISWEKAARSWGIPLTEIPECLFEAAILAKTNLHAELPAIDFYNERERDFVIAFWVNRWSETANTVSSMRQKFSCAVQTGIGTSSLRWFLRKQPTILAQAAKALTNFESPVVRGIIVSSLWKSIDHFCEADWLLDVIKMAVNDDDQFIKTEAAKLIAVARDDQRELAKIIADDEELIESLISVEESDISESLLQVTYETLRDLHWDYVMGESTASPITKTLISLIELHDDNVCRNALTALGFIEPDLLLQEVPNVFLAKAGEPIDYIRSLCTEGVGNAVYGLQENYYGSLCPGYLEILQDNPVQMYEEYLKMQELCHPVITRLYPEKCASDLAEILESLYPDEKHMSILQQEFGLAYRIPSPADVLARKYQLPLPFPESDIAFTPLNDNENSSRGIQNAPFQPKSEN